MDQSLVHSIADTIDRLESELVERLQELIRIPSVTGSEHDVQQAIARQMNDLTLDVDMWEPDAAELAPYEIMVNALAPGFVDTPMSILSDGSHEYDAAWFQDIYVKYGRIPLRRPQDLERLANGLRKAGLPEH